MAAGDGGGRWWRRTAEAGGGVGGQGGRNAGRAKGRSSTGLHPQQQSKFEFESQPYLNSFEFSNSNNIEPRLHSPSSHPPRLAFLSSPPAATSSPMSSPSSPPTAPPRAASTPTSASTVLAASPITSAASPLSSLSGSPTPTHAPPSRRRFRRAWRPGQLHHTGLLSRLHPLMRAPLLPVFVASPLASPCLPVAVPAVLRRLSKPRRPPRSRAPLTSSQRRRQGGREAAVSNRDGHPLPSLRRSSTSPEAA